MSSALRAGRYFSGWSEIVRTRDRLKVEILTIIEDNLGEEWHQVTETIILILMQILQSFFIFNFF